VTAELSAGGTGTAVRHAEQYAFLAVTGNGDGDVAHLKGVVPASSSTACSRR
jgi:hypothetical protein